jgi:RNA-directed DNA polymerase
MNSISRFLTDRLKLKVNEAKSAVAKPYERSFLGFSIVRGGKTSVSAKARERLKAKIREITGRNRGCSLRRIIGELATCLHGWKGYFRAATAKSNLRELSSWMMRKLRCFLWKQWGSRGYREVRKRGVSRDLAWNTSKSAHGPWRISALPADKADKKHVVFSLSP